MSTDDPKDPARTADERPEPKTPDQVAALVRTILDEGGPVVPSKHFKTRGRERDFDTQDALEVMRNGLVAPTPVWNERVGSWNYHIAGVDLEREALTVRIAFYRNDTGIVLVTAF